MANHYEGKEAHRQNLISMDRPVYLEWTRAITAYLPPALRGKALADIEACGVSRNIDRNAAALAAARSLPEGWSQIDLPPHACEGFDARRRD